MNRTSRATAALAALLLGLVFALGSAVPVAFAEGEADDGSVTWSVSPGDANGPDGRLRVESTLDPGDSIVEHMVVKNLSTTAVTFAIKAADGYRTDSGRFNMLNSDETSVDAGLWIDAPETVSVGAGETAVVEFTITVPDDVTPGDHIAGIAASIESLGSDAGGNQISVESRVGFPIFLRVNGEITPSLELTLVSASYQFSWNPFAPGEVTAIYEVANDGNVRMEARPTVESQGNVVEPESDAKPIEVLPGNTRQITTSVPGVWPLFFSSVQVTVDPTVITLEGDPQPAEALSQDIGVWTIPVPQLLVLLGLALVVVAIVLGRRRSQRQLAAKLEAARDAGRREAQQ
jgi:hypothetical protein